MSDAVAMLERNLSALAMSDPLLAQKLRTTPPAALEWSPSKAGPWTASIHHDGRQLPLASRFDPIAEAGKLISHVDLRKHAGIIMLGAGLGYHIIELARQIKSDTVLIVFEPDLSLLRAVFERIDHTSWLIREGVIIADAAMDRAGLLNRVEKVSGLLTQGTVLVPHPPSRAMYGDKLSAFGEVINEVISFCRTNIATALVNSARTYHNLTCNLAHYVAGNTTDELHGAARGCPAVCVSAGPSLARNVHLLTDPRIRRNVVVITAQTTLKPLLARGIRPDFVTALDYHEISRRFYEGLPPLPDVTLVAEPKANPTIIDSFPGPVRLTSSRYLDRLAGELARPRVAIRDGATVAHLSFYLAQHLGCDPILLIGQDLGFSDGLYYCPGTAIHDVWAPELGPFNTLEMMEWQRIVRHRRHLHKMDDIHGRPIYSDEQMVTYLKQFERDFATATQQVIDCTEGGLRKTGTSLMPLADALAKHATRPVPRLPLPRTNLDAGRLAAIESQLLKRIGEIDALDRLADEAIPILRRMIEHQRDERKFIKLFDKLQEKKDQVHAIEPTFSMVNDLNTVGVFRRVRADRSISHDLAHESDPLLRQRKQLDRDIDNIEWLRQAYAETRRIFEAGLTAARKQKATHKMTAAA